MVIASASASMKFGKEFRTHLEETLPEWRDKFLCYKPLKKLLKQIPATPTPDVLGAAAAAAAVAGRHSRHPSRVDTDGEGVVLDAATNRPWMGLEEWFVRILNEELEKFNDFYVDKEEEFIIRLQELKERIEKVKEKNKRVGVLTSEGKLNEEMLEVRKDFVTIHGEMVLLKNYSSLNFAGLTKILKKYDKRTGGLLLLPFTQRALNQPFFTTEPLTRLVRDCETNLEVLFPLEAEVVETNPRDHMEQHHEDITNAPAEASSSLGEDATDIYRSTLAAMRTIKGLRKASSTYNPLSYASLFQSQDDDSAGAVTVENLASNSSSTLDNEETEEEDARSFKL